MFKLLKSNIIPFLVGTLSAAITGSFIGGIVLAFAALLVYNKIVYKNWLGNEGDTSNE